MSKPETIMIDDQKYVRADMVEKSDEKLDGMEYVIVRTQNAGVFAGYLSEKEPSEVILKQARRIWYWDGAASLSQLAMEGTSKPSSCKFPCEVKSVNLSQWIEIIPCTEKARKSIKEVSVWKN